MDADIPQLLTTAIADTTNLLPSDPVASDIDWATLLSSSFSFENQKTPCENEVLISDNIAGREAHGGKNKGKMMGKVVKKAALPRIAFHTRSSEDVLDDGFRWRKYGQKAVKHSSHPRSYYRCTHHTCNVKKQIQRHWKDPSIVVTTYEGIHNHPCEKLMETLSPLLKQLQFLSSI